MNRLKIKIGFVITLGLISLTILSAYTLVTSTTSAITVSGESPLTATANAAVHVADACTMTGTLNTAHTATIKPGITHVTDYPDGIGLTTLNVVCNDNGGYAIYAAGYTGGEVGGTNSTKLIGETTNLAISTGTATSGSTSNWSMKLFDTGTTNPPTIASGFNAFHDVPADYTLVASKTGSTGSTASTIKATYGAYIAGTQAADTYNGKVIYIMVHPTTETPPVEVACANNKICYNANTNIKQGTMGRQSITSSATSATLIASNFSKDGYGFAGWNTKPDYSGTFYGPNETITFTAGAYSSGGLPLYAVWVKSAGTMQNWSGCSGITSSGTTGSLASVTALTDARDGQTYAVAKLADGKCWMIENLRLEAENSYDATQAQGYGASATYGNFTGLATAESANFNNTNPPVANSLYSTDGSTANTITGGYSSYYYARMPRYNNNNTQSRASSPTIGGNNIYSYGNYYTWSAAMANVKQYSDPASTDDEGKTSETANTSLCPTGWKLPRGGNKSREATNDFWSLTVMGINNGINPANYDSSTAPYYAGTSEGSNVDISNALRAFPNNFVYSGYIAASEYSKGGEGRYWSSTPYGQNSTYTLYVGVTNNVYPGTYSNSFKYNGYTVRCIADF